MTRPAIVTELQAEMDHWDGFGVHTEWFVSFDGMSALGVFGSGESMQIMSIDANGDGTVATSATDPVEFSTGGPEV